MAQGHISLSDTRNPSALSLEERNSVEVGTFQPSFGFKTVTTSPWMGRSKPRCGPRPSLSFEDAYHPCWGGERGEPGLYLPHGSAGDLLFQLLDGEKQAGLRSWFRPQLQGCSSSLLGRKARRARALPPARVGWPPLLPASGGGNHPPALRRRRPPAMPGKANYCCPARMVYACLIWLD